MPKQHDFPAETRMICNAAGHGTAKQLNRRGRKRDAEWCSQRLMMPEASPSMRINGKVE
jgi:hypothetical protein